MTMSRLAVAVALALGLFAAPTFAQVCDPKKEVCPPPPCDPKTLSGHLPGRYPLRPFQELAPLFSSPRVSPRPCHLRC